MFNRYVDVQKMNVLEEANRLIHGDRNQQYGHPLDNHSTTAAFFNIYIAALRRRGKLELDAADICWLNVLQKVSREATTGSSKRDTAVDVAGYAGNVEMVWDELKARELKK